MVPININFSEILRQKIKELVELKLQSKEKKWTPGVDFVQYSGSLFDENEYIAAIETLLDGWLALKINFPQD